MITRMMVMMMMIIMVIGARGKGPRRTRLKLREHIKQKNKGNTKKSNGNNLKNAYMFLAQHCYPCLPLLFVN